MAGVPYPGMQTATCRAEGAHYTNFGLGLSADYHRSHLGTEMHKEDNIFIPKSQNEKQLFVKLLFVQIFVRKFEKSGEKQLNPH